MIGVGFDFPKTRTSDGLDFDALSERALKEFLQAIDVVVYVDWFGIKRLSARKCQQATGQRRGSLRASFGVCERPVQIGSGRLGVPFSCLEIAKDDHEQIVEVVRDPAAELPHRLQLLGCGELLLNVLELVLSALSVRNVARDFGEPDDVSGLVRDAIDDDRRPKAGAVFSQAPAFRFEATMLRRL